MHIYRRPPIIISLLKAINCSGLISLFVIIAEVKNPLLSWFEIVLWPELIQSRLISLAVNKRKSQPRFLMRIKIRRINRDELSLDTGKIHVNKTEFHFGSIPGLELIVY